MGFWGLLEVIRLALEIYKALKGKPQSERDQIKAQLFDRALAAQNLKQEIKESGDASKLEKLINNDHDRHSLR